MGLLEIGWFVGFISCFLGIDGDWIWLLGLFLGFGKNMMNCYKGCVRFGMGGFFLNLSNR